MPVVTISGTYGSGALDVGRLVADRLGVDYVDQQLLVDVAQRLGVPVQSMAQRDERTVTFGQRLAIMLRNFLERSAAAGGDPAMGSAGLEVLLSRSYAEMAAQREGQELSGALYLKTITAIIREMAQRGDVIIIGRGSQMVLRDQPGVLHVLIMAPEAVRIQRYAEREGLTLEEACRQVRDGDKGRAAFHRKFWKADVNDPSLYDLVVNTYRVGYEVAADLVAAAARAKAATSL